jgi:hypothetical protein
MESTENPSSDKEIMNMNRKWLGIILLVVGVVLLILSVVADMIGIGGAPGFGYKQIAGVIVGILLAGAGWYLNSRK